MKIKTKLIIGFTLILLLLVSITSFGYERLTVMNKLMTKVSDDRYEKVKSAISIRGGVNASARVINDILLSEQEAKAGIEEITQKLSTAGEQYKKLSKMNLDTNEEQALAKIMKLSDGYIQALKSFIGYVNEGDIAEARKIYSDVLRENQTLVIDSLDELVQLEEGALANDVEQSNRVYEQSVRMVAALTAIGLLLGLGIVFWVFPSITKGLNLLSRMADRFGKGRLRGFTRFQIESTDELGHLAKVFKQIALDLQMKNENETFLSDIQQRQGRMDAQRARVTELLQKNMDVKQVAEAFISEFSPVLGASYGLLYLTDMDGSKGHMELSGAYAAAGDSMNLQATPTVVRTGEGLTGQCLKDGKRIVITDVPEGYLEVKSGLGEMTPKNLLIQPIMFEEKIIGVIELASLKTFDSENLELLQSLCEKLGTIVNNIHSKQRVEELLKESQAMTEELQSQSEELICQQEELRETNDRLETQRNDLRKSEHQLQQQQEELELVNQNLTIKTLSLEESVERMELQNSQIAKANYELERQALQLALTSKYKSEFLANMSHELRTPLNSLLILSEFLSENKEGNLNEKQLEYMRTIHYSGNDLLKMIDEILDLSKIDAGKMDIHPEWMVVDDITNFLKHTYTPVAAQKDLALNIEYVSEIPNAIWTDGHRLKQILRNLMSNAIKFTDKGSISLNIRRPKQEEQDNDFWQEGTPYIAFSVTDSGIGIDPEKSELIFEAFRQADGTTSRKYGGTGLGLTISRELARLLGGWIHLDTKPDAGSTFTLVIPEQLAEQIDQPEGLNESFTSDLAAASSEIMNNFPSSLKGVAAEKRNHHIEDDRASISEKDRVILIVEDDINFAKVLVEMARSRGFKVIVSTQGDEGIYLAVEFKPSAVLLDIQLPVADGWSVLNELKNNPETRHIPVHVISLMERSAQGLRMGAIDHLQKPASREQLESVFTQISEVLDNQPKQLLLIEQKNEWRDQLTELIVHDDVVVIAVADSVSGWNKLMETRFDCIVLDANLPDGASIEFLERIQQSRQLSRIPIIVYSGEDDDIEMTRKIRRYGEKITIKEVKSPERLLEETTLFLHRVEAELPEDKRLVLKQLKQSENTFKNKKILLVDDDVRNVFALSSVLESHQMSVVYAENGLEALEKLQEENDFDLILMDIMMPEMDGYEAMKRIRENNSWSKLPIIALTAKAMKDDRNKCIEAGASDYITKPINTDQLLSLMRVWLYR